MLTLSMSKTLSIALSMFKTLSIALSVSKTLVILLDNSIIAKHTVNMCFVFINVVFVLCS